MTDRAPQPKDGEDDHWLVRRSTIRWLWLAFAAVLALLVAADLILDKHPHFDIDGWFAFYAVFGFVACYAMIVFSKALGVLIKRPDDYYDDG